MFTDEQKAMLDAPLKREHVKERKQAGRQLSYIEGWHAIAEANRIFGHGNWDRSTHAMCPVCKPYQMDRRDRDNRVVGKLWYVSYTARVTITVYAEGNPRVVQRDGESAHPEPSASTRCARSCTPPRLTCLRSP